MDSVKKLFMAQYKAHSKQIETLEAIKKGGFGEYSLLAAIALEIEKDTLASIESRAKEFGVDLTVAKEYQFL